MCPKKNVTVFIWAAVTKYNTCDSALAFLVTQVQEHKSHVYTLCNLRGKVPTSPTSNYFVHPQLGSAYVTSLKMC